MLLDQINLTTRERIDHRIRYLLYGGMAVFVVVISLVNLVKGYQLHQERTGYTRKLAALQQEAQKLKDGGPGGADIRPKDYQAMMNRGLASNRLIALDLFPWIKVLNALERALPDVVIIDSFQPVDGFSRIHLAGRTDSLEELVDFQKRLEESDLFTAVVLENMGLGDSGAEGSMANERSRMAFKLHCRLQLDQVLPVQTHGALWLTLDKAPKIQ